MKPPAVSMLIASGIASVVLVEPTHSAPLGLECRLRTDTAKCQYFDACLKATHPAHCTCVWTKIEALSEEAERALITKLHILHDRQDYSGVAVILRKLGKAAARRFAVRFAAIRLSIRRSCGNPITRPGVPPYPVIQRIRWPNAR